MTQSETQERLKQRIRKTLQTMRRVEHDNVHAHAYVRDVTKLLSLIDTRAPVDSQGAGDPTAIDYSSALKFVNEWLWNPPAFGSADRSTDQMPWHDPYKQDAAQMVIAASNRAATQMRTACVEKVKECLAERARTSPESEDYEYDQAVCYVLYGVIDKLSSLTLDKVKQKGQSK